MAKEKPASPGNEIHLCYRVQVTKNKEQFSMSKIVASTESWPRHDSKMPLGNISKTLRYEI